MNDHVAISVNHQTAPPSSSSSSSSSGRISEISEEHVAEIYAEEISPLLNQRKEEKEGEEGGGEAKEEGIWIQRDLTPERTHLAGKFGAGFSHYINMVIPVIPLRTKAEHAEKVVVVSEMVAAEAHKFLATTSTDVKNNLTKENDVFEHGNDDTVCCESNGMEISIKLRVAECRICQEEDDIANLESPCACSGSLKFAHRNCVQHWCNEKGDTMCEICQKPFEGGYVCPQPIEADSVPINVSAGWDIANGQPRLFSLVADHQILDTSYDEYAGSHAHNAACFRSVALMLVALLLLRHILSMTGADDEDASAFFMLSLVRAAGFLIPCYIMARAMNALQMRQQQQEAPITATEVRYLFQAGQAQAIVSPGIRG